MFRFGVCGQLANSEECSEAMSAPSSIANKAALLLGCPQCNNLVTLPQAISLQALVRCPLCRSTFHVHTALPSDVPELEVVGQEFAAATQSPFGNQAKRMEEDEMRLSPDEKLPVAKALREGAKRRRHGRSQAVHVSADTEISQPLFDPQMGEQVAAVTEQNQAALMGRGSSRGGRSSRSRSNSESAWIEVAKIVAGALLALPVSQLIIWWGLGLDPFGLAPKVGQVLPAVVPEKLLQPPANPPADTPQQQTKHSLPPAVQKATA
jgi:hypothetical protein